jgi:apolipoprotein N-acyltransferase
MLQFVGKWTGSYVIGAVPWILATLLFSLYFGLAGLAATKALTRGWWWLVPLAWVGTEVLRSYMPVIAFPWGIYAMPLAQVPLLASMAHFGMIYLVSGWLVLINIIVLRLVISGSKGLPKFQPAWVVVALSAMLTGFANYATPDPGEPRRIVAIQPGVDLAFGDPSTEELRLEASINPRMHDADLQNPYLIVLPEGIAEATKMPPKVPFDLPQSSVIFGGQRGANPRFQSSFALSREKWQYADKTRLVIFGEFVPFRDLLPKSLKLPSGDLVPGQEGVKGFRIERDTVGPLLCFEALFPDLAYRQQAGGANMLAIMSIDDWFAGTAATQQLRSAAIWRAVETNLPVARVGSLGATLLIDGHGNVLAEAPMSVPATLSGMLNVSRPVAPFPNYWFPVVSVVMLAIALVLPRKKPAAK